MLELYRQMSPDLKKFVWICAVLAWALPVYEVIIHA